jgi:hypothetical protein
MKEQVLLPQRTTRQLAAIQVCLLETDILPGAPFIGVIVLIPRP